MIYRGGSNSGNQCASVQRGLDRTTGNEEYVLVPDGNILSLATQKLLQIYPLLLKFIL